mmetsp:Transcript_83122/g.144419  ORF Transcript_83122/g.144419 Transcript_83122/m.144419 type:complete len:468 (-) Transcript_83122:133-1536(-)
MCTLIPRIAVLLLACASLVHGKVEGDSCDAKIASLEKSLKAIKEENQNLKSQLEKANIPQSEIPYFSAEVLTHSVGALRHFSNLALARGKAAVPVPEWVSMDKLVGPTQAVANASLAALMKAKDHGTTLALMGLETGKKSAVHVSNAAHDLYSKKAAPYAETYVNAGAELYTTHVGPAMTSGRKLYSEKVHPHLGRHVGLAQEKLTVAAGAAFEQSKTLVPLIQQYAEVARVNLQAQLNSLRGPILDKLLSVLAKITEPRTFTIGGRKFSFPWGFLDICLLAVQAFVFSCVALVISWKFFLKTLLWKIGLKFLGRKMLIGVSYSVIKVSYRITRILVSLSVYLVKKVLRLVYLVVLLVAFCGMGLLLSLSAGKGAALAKPGLVIDVGLLLIAGLCLGVMLFLCTWCKCCCCRKRAPKAKAAKEVKEQPAKKKAPPAKEVKEAPAKQEKASKMDAKQAQQTKKNGKKS